MVYPEGNKEYSCIFGDAVVYGIIEVMICKPVDIDIEPLLQLMGDEMWVYDEAGIVRSNSLEQVVDWMEKIANK